MSGLVGQSLSHYRIVEKIGEGGMGEVYRAHDERLDRDVAIKVLAHRVAGDQAWLDRFRREARAVASLSHPNILAIFELGLHEGTTFMVTELLTGDSLRSVIRTGPAPVSVAIDHATQIAEGLAAAHDQGIVHRDLKPDNVFVCSNGQLKILDFGLARLEEPVVEEKSAVPTATLGTTPGAVVGTVGYMSPEQVRGERADQRSDVFAFGCVLYELVTGQRAFRRDTAAETMTAILKTQPPRASESGVPVPVELGSILKKCLEKDAANRFQSGRELAGSLYDIDASKGGRRQPESRPSIAVLPFANLSMDPEQEYFCDGMSEEIINALAHVDGLRVVARTSSFAFKGQHVDIRDLGERLDVTTVLEGSVRKAGDRLRITAQLIDVIDGFHLWSERFDRRLEHVFEVQDEISLAIVDRLKVKLLGREQEAVVRRYTDNLDAYNIYLEGLYNWNKLTKESYARSVSCYEKAIRIDPGFAPAYVGLGIWHLSQSFWAAVSPQDGIPKALDLSEKALSIDGDIPEVHSLIGCAEVFFLRNRVAGERSLRRGVELGPNVAGCHSNLAIYLLFSGQHEEAAAEARRTIKLDPLSSNLVAWAGAWLAYAGHVEEGVAEIRRMVELHPDDWLPHHQLSDVLFVCKGDLEQALTESQRAVELSGGLAIATAQLATMMHLVGRHEEAQELTDELVARSTRSYVAPVFFVQIYLARGDVDAALARLEEAAEVNDGWLFFVRTWAAAVPTKDPRIDEFLDRLGM